MTLFSMELGGIEVGRAWKLHSYPHLPLQDAARRKLSVQFSGPPRERAQRCSVHAFPARKSGSVETRLTFFGPISCAVNGKYAVSKAETDELTSLDEEALVLKKKAEEIILDLNGTCIFLVGMMGSGKTTVGKILSEALGYYFFDSDKLVEQAAGGASVAQIFKERHEKGFRDSESEVLKQLSSMCRLVVATGGGAVIRPENWNYMRRGITVWLDVPVEALAARVAAVGTESRPLLGKATGDCYSQALTRLTKLYEDRSEAYANSDARVSLQETAAELNYKDVSALTPTVIAIEGDNYITRREKIRSLLMAKRIWELMETKVAEPTKAIEKVVFKRTMGVQLLPLPC